MGKVKYISLQDFLYISNIKESTFRKNFKKIPGVTYKNRVFKILEGTRYSYNMRRSKPKTTENRMFVLLKAIDETKYINHLMLRSQPSEFRRLLAILLEAGLIERNDSSNIYGANAYSITMKGIKYRKENRRESIRFITTLTAECSGILVGQIVSKIFPISQIGVSL